MERMSLKDLSIPLIKSIDSFNYLLKSHHRRTAVISYYLGTELGLDNHDMTLLLISAALHDIGALSVQERDTLIQEDFMHPEPHCKMGYKMLSTFDAFADIAQIIKYHHVRYDKLDTILDNVMFQSHIIHCADRIDILIDPHQFILNQRQKVYDKITAKKGTVFHPDVVDAFEKTMHKDVFWIEINNMTIEELFSKINFSLDMDLSIENITSFAHTIAQIIDFRSEFTISHSYTVAHLAYHISKKMGYSTDFCNKQIIAGYLHDIGKIGIDPGILEKHGKLTAEEFNQIRLHSYYSAQILRELTNNTWFEDVVKWCSYHHEKNDGSGYPYSNDKPLDDGSKILEFSDILAALTENRPYREPSSIDKALEIIDQNHADIIGRDVFDKIVELKDYLEDIIIEAHSISNKIYLDIND